MPMSDTCNSPAGRRGIPARARGRTASQLAHTCPAGAAEGGGGRRQTARAALRTSALGRGFPRRPPPPRPGPLRPCPATVPLPRDPARPSAAPSRPPRNPGPGVCTPAAPRPGGVCCGHRSPRRVSGSGPGDSSPHEVVAEVLAPDIVRRLSHQRTRHGRAGHSATLGAAANAPWSPMTPVGADSADTEPSSERPSRQLGPALRPLPSARLSTYGRAQSGRRGRGLAPARRTPPSRPSAARGVEACCRKTVAVRRRLAGGC